jgi:superfamily II DNA or RNA helicase
METVKITKLNEVYAKVESEVSTAYELKDYFTFKAENYRFHPKYRARLWNGDISLFNLRDRQIYAGLIPKIQDFCRDRKYKCEVDDELLKTDKLSSEDAKLFIADLNLPLKFETRNYQIDSFVHCVQSRRSLFISPTASGKSMIIYWLVRYYNTKTLIIVNSLNLLHQMFSDFKEYGFDAEKNIHKIYSGTEKDSKKKIYITTWQSAYKHSPEWFKKFDLVICDEAHLAKALSLKKIMESLVACPYRFGFTGSLDNSKSNKLTLEGLFGPYMKIKSTKDLIDEGFLSDVFIKAIILKYPDIIRKQSTKLKYEDELQFLYNNSQRNNFIENLALSLEGNTLLLFQRVDSHGKLMYNHLLMKESNTPIYYVSGEVKGEDREIIRNIVMKHDKSIIVASVGCFSTGVNIPNINNIIVSSPTKSIIRVLQTIGRGLRKTNDKYIFNLYDITDNLQWKSHKNYTLKHFEERIRIYNKEEFNYKIYTVPLGN